MLGRLVEFFVEGALVTNPVRRGESVRTRSRPRYRGNEQVP